MKSLLQEGYNVIMDSSNDPFTILIQIFLYIASCSISIIIAAKLSRKKKSRTNLTCTKLDHSRLVFDYHNVMVASLGFLPGLNTSHGLKQHVKVLLIGLGGGALPTFINKYLYNVCTG